MSQPTPILYHAHHSRSQMILCMLEEMGIAYDVRLVKMAEGEQSQPEFHALNPMEKVPTLMHGDVVVSETGAILTYLADVYPEANLAPAPSASQERATYLRWLFFGGNCVEPACWEIFSPRKEPPNPGQTGWGDFPRVVRALREGIQQGPYLLGERFSAADVLIGSQAAFLVKYEVIDTKRETEIAAYAARCNGRPAWQRVLASEEKQPNPWG